MEKLNLMDTDQFGIVKIFSDASIPKSYIFKLGEWGEDGEDRDHFPGRTYGSCSDSDKNNPKKSVVSTEWEKKDEEFIDQEVTAYLYLPRRESDNNKVDCYKYKRFGKGSSVSIKLRGGSHSDNDPEEKQAHCYIFDFQYEGEDQNNFQKEAPHGTYKKKTIPEPYRKFKLPAIMSKWVGFKAVTINQENGVRCMAFVDFGSQDRSIEDGPDPSLQNWKLYYDIFDNGQLDYIPGDKFTGLTENPFRQHNGNKTTQFRMDRILKPEGKYLSARKLKGGSRQDIDHIVSAY